MLDGHNQGVACQLFCACVGHDDDGPGYNIGICEAARDYAENKSDPGQLPISAVLAATRSVREHRDAVSSSSETESCFSLTTSSDTSLDVSIWVQPETAGWPIKACSLGFIQMVSGGPCGERRCPVHLTEWMVCSDQFN